MKRTFLLGTILSIFLAQPFFAEEKNVVTITIESAVKMALETNISIHREKISLEQSERNYKHSWNNFLPSISASGSITPSGTLSDSDSTVIVSQAGASASLSLSTGIGAKIKSLKADYKAGKASYDDTVRKVENSVRKSFYEVLYKKDSFLVAEENEKSYERSYNLTKTKKERGVVPEIDLLTAEVNLESAKLDKESARIEYMKTLISFLDTVGIQPEPDTEVQIEGSLDAADSISEIKMDVAFNAKKNSPEIRKLREQLESAKLSKTSSSLDSYLPSVNLSASVYPLKNTYYLGSDSSTDSDSWSAGVSVSIPLDSFIYGSKTSDSLKSQQDTIKDFELQIKDKEKSVVADVLSDQQAISLSKGTLKSRNSKVELAKKKLDLTEEAYNRGTKDLETLSDAMDAYRSARLDLKKQQYELLSSVLDLEEKLGLSADTYISKAE